MSDLDKTHNIFHQVIKRIICINIYITIDNVPTGGTFYTKPGLGQCRYSQQGTPDTYASLGIVLYSCMFYLECPAPKTAFPSLNSLPRIGVPSLIIDTIPSRASQAEHTAIRSRAFGVVSSILYSMASVNFPLSQLVCIELILNTEFKSRITAFALNFLPIISVPSSCIDTIPSRAS